MKVHFDVRSVVVLNNYSFKKIILSFKYINEMKIDVTTPVTDKRSVRNLLDSTMNAENTRIIKNNIPKIDNEFFKRIKAYVGTIFSFQWSLIFDEMMTRNTLFVFLRIELT